MRLIDADALKSKVQAQEWKRDPAVMLALDWIYMLINEQPTIDAVPVVRCKDCKHYNTDLLAYSIIGRSKGFGWCENIDRGTSDNFYCANGKQLNKESEGKEVDDC